MENSQNDRYIIPYNDYGFKKLFGTEENKDLLIGFLNALFMGKENIKDIRYLPNERLSQYSGRRAIFDVYCENENGDNFIVEMQNTYQKYYKDRSLYYATFPIQEQAPKGKDWDFKLKKVYAVCILNFVFDEYEEDAEYLHHVVMLMDTKKKTVFYDKLTFLYLEMPKFNKKEDELETPLDKWLYVLKHLQQFGERPAFLQDKVFEKLFEQAEVARFTHEEYRCYWECAKTYLDIKNSIKSAEELGEEKGMKKGLEKGMEKGIKKEKTEAAKRMKADGLSEELIEKYTGLSPEEIRTL